MFKDYKLIEEATALFKIRRLENKFEGLLYPTDSVYAYGEAALLVCGKVDFYEDQQNYLFSVAIVSIDDSLVSFHTNRSTKEKSFKKMDDFIKWIESLYFACPTKDQIQEFCMKNGYTAVFN